ncbi:hypothetical protein BGZ57DRAFT_880446 [Hyaloscypha finlandica]|nr:hypothetical protein BGZ57DRAFT_880446 [Hyaloscypha finlandica]
MKRRVAAKIARVLPLSCTSCQLACFAPPFVLGAQPFGFSAPLFLQPVTSKWLALPYLSSAARTKTTDRVGQPLPFQVFI